MVYGNREGVMSSSHSPEDVKMKKSDPFVIEFDGKLSIVLLHGKIFILTLIYMYVDQW